MAKKDKDPGVEGAAGSGETQETPVAPEPVNDEPAYAAPAEDTGSAPAAAVPMAQHRPDHGWLIAAAVLGGLFLLLLGFLGGALAAKIGPYAISRHMGPVGFQGDRMMGGWSAEKEHRGFMGGRGGMMEGGRGGMMGGERRHAGKRGCDGSAMGPGMGSGKGERGYGHRGSMHERGRMGDGPMSGAPMGGMPSDPQMLEQHEQMHRLMHERMEAPGVQDGTGDVQTIPQPTP